MFFSCLIRQEATEWSLRRHSSRWRMKRHQQVLPATYNSDPRWALVSKWWDTLGYRKWRQTLFATFSATLIILIGLPVAWYDVFLKGALWYLEYVWKNGGGCDTAEDVRFFVRKLTSCFWVDAQDSVIWSRLMRQISPGPEERGLQIVWSEIKCARRLSQRENRTATDFKDAYL